MKLSNIVGTPLTFFEAIRWVRTVDHLIGDGVEIFNVSVRVGQSREAPPKQEVNRYLLLLHVA